MLDGVIVPVQQMAYSILYFIAEIFWGINQALLLVGYYILSITSWLSEQMFQPLLSSIGGATDSLLLPTFTLAMLTLAITYLMGVFGVFRVVEFRSAVMWMLVALMWFQFGPEIYLGFEQFRRELSGGFYGTTYTDLTGGDDSITGLDQIGDGGNITVNPPTNNFGPFLPFDSTIDGLDIALAYLDADGCDVLRTTGCLTFLEPDGSSTGMPTRWYAAGSYFDLTQHGFLFPAMSNSERQASMDAAAAGIWRALSGIVVSLFGMIEQIVQLLLTIAFGIAFASFFIAILFAFFKRTESVTWAVFDIILGLFIQSIITSLLLALVMAFVSVAGATGNGVLLLGVGFLGIVLVTILLLGAVTAILKALNGLMGSFGQVTGGSLDAAGTVTKIAGAYATGGATLAAGGSIAQSVGGLLGPGASQHAYYASRAFGGSNTALGRFANDVATGASASYLGPAGGVALGLTGPRETANLSEVGQIASGQRPVSDLTLGTPIRVEANDIRHDPVTDADYNFSQQDNGQGVRTYADGSHLNTNRDDEPLNRERAREERRAYRRQDEGEAGGYSLSQDAIHQIDASDDDENAAIASSIIQLRSLLASGLTGEDEPRDISVILPPPENTVEPVNTSPPTSDGSPQVFLAEVEGVYPGSTQLDDLTPVPPPSMSTPAHTPTPTARSDDDVQSVPSVGPATTDRLVGLGITTAGGLANADPAQLATLDQISPARANQLVNAAQTYLGGTDQTDIRVVSSATTPTTAPVSSNSDAGRVAAAIDASNNDDAARLAVNIGAAVSQALTTGRVPNSQQVGQIVQQTGLPAGKEATQFVQVASAMNLSPGQAQGVIQEVSSNGQMGTETAQAIRSSLANLTLPGTGGSLDDAGLSRAVGNLERAAQALVTASNSIATTAEGGSVTTSEQVTSGQNNPQTTPQRIELNHE